MTKTPENIPFEKITPPAINTHSDSVVGKGVDRTEASVVSEIKQKHDVEKGPRIGLDAGNTEKTTVKQDTNQVKTPPISETPSLEQYNVSTSINLSDSTLNALNVCATFLDLSSSLSSDQLDTVRQLSRMHGLDIENRQEDYEELKEKISSELKEKEDSEKLEEKESEEEMLSERLEMIYSEHEDEIEGRIEQAIREADGDEEKLALLLSDLKEEMAEGIANAEEDEEKRVGAGGEDVEEKDRKGGLRAEEEQVCGKVVMLACVR